MSTTYRGGIRSLEYCPRCVAKSCCDGKNKSFDIPRSYSYVYSGGFADMGFWCECCFSQLWRHCGSDVKAWLQEISGTPDRWVVPSFDGMAMKSISRHLTEASKAAGLGCAWQDQNDEHNPGLVLNRGADWPLAGIDPKAGRKTYYMPSGIASMVPRDLLSLA